MLGRVSHGRVRHVELVEGVEAIQVSGGECAPDRAPVADHERGHGAGPDLGQRALHPLLVLGERFAAREAEVLARPASTPPSPPDPRARCPPAACPPSRRGSTPGGARPAAVSSPSSAPTISAVSRARPSVLDQSAAIRLPFTACASSRACARPASFSGTSRQPCTRAGGALSSVSPCRASRITRWDGRTAACRHAAPCAASPARSPRRAGCSRGSRRRRSAR